MDESSERPAPTANRRKFLKRALAALGGAVTLGGAAVLASNQGSTNPEAAEPGEIPDIELGNLSEAEKAYLKQLNDFNRQIRQVNKGANPEEPTRTTTEAYRLAFDRRRVIKDWMKQYPQSLLLAMRHSSNKATRDQLETKIKDQAPDYLPPSFQLPKDHLVERDITNWTGTLGKVLPAEGGGKGPGGYDYEFSRKVNGQHSGDFNLLEIGQPKPFPIGHVGVESGIAIERTALPDPGAVKPLNPSSR